MRAYSPVAVVPAKAGDPYLRVAVMGPRFREADDLKDVRHANDQSRLQSPIHPCRGAPRRYGRRGAGAGAIRPAHVRARAWRMAWWMVLAKSRRSSRTARPQG